jgi:phosphohistidine phosphatase SixA
MWSPLARRCSGGSVLSARVTSCIGRICCSLFMTVVWGLLFMSSAIRAPAQSPEEFWAVVKKPGTIVLMRHSNAPENGTETDDRQALAPSARLRGLDLKDCKVQRNLDEDGRAQASRAGDEFRKNGIEQAKMVASQYCRARETAQLMKLGELQETPVLNLVPMDNPLRMREAADKTKELMKTMPARPVSVLVTHQGNIWTVTGANAASGEMIAVRLDQSGEVTVAGRLMVK